ncbi:MAG: peptidoglycan-binding protein [Acidobacteriia bacterium]|nr:peptidoglycan-binding protein [Terriglobia bacterium]
MRSKAIVVVLALSTALALWAAIPASKSKKTTGKATGTKKAAPKGSKGSSSKGSTSKGSKSKGTKAVAGKKSTSANTAAARYRRSTQKEPVPERYKEIQRSLADRGYFAGPVNGTWGPDSVEALKRFQRDQNIGDDGKLGSLSLIALGLGPKRGASEAGGGEKPANPETGEPSPP